MRRIINGRLYNTETAEEIGSWHNGYGTNDFKHCEETLYRKRAAGSYFLAGSGGAMSKYAQAFGDSTGGGEGIEPLTEAEAKAWAEEHLAVEEYVAAFGEPVE